MTAKKRDSLTGQIMTEGRARDALVRLSGDADAHEYLERYMSYLKSENARLTLDNASLRGESRPKSGTQELTVRAGSGEYTRSQPLILMKWTCDICGQSHERYQLPGNTPRYCPTPDGAAQSDCQREAARRRVAKSRRKHAMHNPLQRVEAAPPSELQNIKNDAAPRPAPGMQVRLNLPDNPQHGETGYVVSADRHWIAIPDNRVWVNFKIDGQPVIKDYAIDTLEVVRVPFLHDYVPAKTRKQTPLHFTLSDERRDVLAAVAAGQSSVDSADYQAGLHRRKIARALADNGLLAEMSGAVKHQQHWWKLTEAALRLIRRDEDLQQRVLKKQDMHNTLPVPDAAPAVTPPVSQPDEAAPDKKRAPWDALNERQRHYLTAIYEVDQSQEEDQRVAGAMGDWDRQPASEWRWIRYYSEHGDTEVQEAIGREHIDPGTGSTFAALEKRGLIETTGNVDQFNLKIKITKQGRAAVRAALGVKSNAKPAGLLSEWTWKALKLAYEAGNDGVTGERWTAHYGGISWETWLRLRNHKKGEMVEEFPGGGGLRITWAGRGMYLERLSLHQQHYPHLYQDTTP